MTAPSSRLVTPVLLAGCAVLMLSFSIRAGFGLFQIPVQESFGWARSEFSLAIAIQNLAWGFGQPVFGMIAERWGDRKAVILGALIYALGLSLSALATTPGEMQLLNILIGCGIAGTGFGVVLSVVGRSASPQNRSIALGIATAAGSAGQVVGPPVIERLLETLSVDGTFFALAGVSLTVILLLPFLKAPVQPAAAGLEEPFAKVMGSALRDPSFTLIFLGFFSCGYQLAFITAHFPAFVAESCGPIDPAGLLAGMGLTTTSQLGAWSIALIGIANVAGTIYAGVLGGRYSRKYLLAAIYVARTIIAALFIALPMTPGSVLLFSVAMGALWLATVPLTAGLVGHIWGMRYMGTLYGLVFLSHQIGGFLGVWLGGALYDIYGNYDLVWWVGVVVGAFSAVVHLPVKEHARGLSGAAA